MTHPSSVKVDLLDTYNQLKLLQVLLDSIHNLPINAISERDYLLEILEEKFKRQLASFEDILNTII